MGVDNKSSRRKCLKNKDDENQSEKFVNMFQMVFSQHKWFKDRKNERKNHVNKQMNQKIENERKKKSITANGVRKKRNKTKK